MLGTAGHARLDLGLPQVRGDVLDDLLEEDVAARGPLGDQPGDLVVALGVQRREGQVLEFPLDRVHAEPVGQRREDLQHLTRLAFLLLPGQVAQGAHVVQPVGELDDQDPDVAGHRDDHLAHGLGLGDLAVLDLVQLGDPVHQGRDLVPEIGPQLVEGVVRVLHRVVQQGRAQRLVVHAQLGEDRGHGERVGDVRVAALALLPGVPVRGHLVGVLDQPDIRLGVGRAHRLDHRFENGIDPPAAGRAEPGQAARGPSRSRAAPGARAPAAGLAPAVRRAGTRAYPGRLRRITARGVTGPGICAGQLRDRRRCGPTVRGFLPCPARARGLCVRGLCVRGLCVRGLCFRGSCVRGVTVRGPGGGEHGLVREGRSHPGSGTTARCHVTGHRHSSRPPGAHSIGGRSGQCRTSAPSHDQQ